MRLTCCFSTGLAAGVVCLGISGLASAQELGSIKGTFVIEGEAPTVEPKYPAGADVKDSAICAAQDIPNLSLVVDPETKGLANVVIWIEKFDEDDIPESLAKPKEEKVVLDQKNCLFLPHVTVARTGQTLVMLNGDPVAHNVHINAIRGDSFNQSVAANDRKGLEHPLEKPDMLPVSVTCDIHNWMKGHILILDHPYAAKSDEKGSFEITGIPPGEYTFKVWHENSGWLDDFDGEEHEIEAGKTVDLGKLMVDGDDVKPQS